MHFLAVRQQGMLLWSRKRVSSKSQLDSFYPLPLRFVVSMAVSLIAYENGDNWFDLSAGGRLGSGDLITQSARVANQLRNFEEL